MAGKKFSFVLSEEEDPVVFAMLTKLDRYARGKRIRHMLRTAALIESSGSQIQTDVFTAPATLSDHVSKNSKLVLNPLKSSRAWKKLFWLLCRRFNLTE